MNIGVRTRTVGSRRTIVRWGLNFIAWTSLLFSATGAIGGPETEVAEQQSRQSLAADEDLALLASLPHSVSQAYFQVFVDTIGFAFEGGAWASNLQAAILWRADLAEIQEECFPEGRKDCLPSRLFDRELVLDAFEKGLPADDSEWESYQSLNRDIVVARTVDLMAHLLAPSIDSRYHLAESADGRGPDTPPEIAHGILVSLGRSLRQRLNLDPLDGYAANIAFVILSQPGDDLQALPIILVDRKLPIRIQGRIPPTLNAVTRAEVLDHLRRPESQARVLSILVPEGKTGGASVYLIELANRAVVLLNEGRFDDGLELIEAALRESENPELNRFLSDLRQKAQAYRED
jgi:hypothetical protein